MSMCPIGFGDCHECEHWEAMSCGYEDTKEERYNEKKSSNRRY